MRAFSRVLIASLLALPTALAAQAPAVITPGDNLVSDGIPAIPRSLADDVRRYTEARTASLADWHPTRREILIATRFGNTPQLHAVALPLGARQQLTFFDEPVRGGSYDPKTASLIVFNKDRGGDEFTQLYGYDVANGSITLLSDGGRSQNGNVMWSNAGDRFAYTTTRRNGADRDIHIINPRDKSSDRLVVQNVGGGWGVTDWSPDDKQLLIFEFESVNRSHIWLVDVASGQKTALTPRTAKDSVAYGDAQFAADGRGVWITTDAGSEFQRLAYLEIASKRSTPITTDIQFDVDNIEVAPDGRTVAFVTNEAGTSKLYLMDATSRRYQPVPGLPVGILSGLQWRPDGSELGFTINSARSPSDVYSLNVKNNEVVRWTHSELGGLVASELSEPELIRWKSFDGREITGYYYKPPARFTGKRPVTISIHGGPEGQYRPGFLGRTNYHLNELGVAIIYPNVRGSTGFGKTFVKLDNGMKREDSVKDIGALLDWIAARPELDASKVLITGGSYGGYMTLAVATNYNARICCSLDVVGISNFITFLQNTESYRRDLRRVEYGDERDPQMRAFFERIAPVNNATKITRPLFVVQGGNDPRVPRTESEQMVATVKRNGTPVWYLMAKDEGHGFAKKNNADFQFYATVMFMRRFLLGDKEAAD